MLITGGSGRKLAALGIAVMLGVNGTACAREESGTPQASEQTSETSSAVTSAPSAAESVEVLNPGADPRETLRFTVAEGAQFRATMTMSMEIGQQFGDEQTEASTTPPMLTDMTATVNTVADNGDIDYTFTIEDVRVGEGLTLPPEAQETLGQMAGITGQASMSATGVHRSFDLELPPDVDPQMRSTLEGMSTQVANISVPLPTEPVGVGSSWRTQTSAELNGIRTDLTTTYTLLERDGDRYRTEVSVEQTAPEQDADLPGLPPGFRTTVTGVAMSGTGQTEGNLTMVFPVTSTMQVGGTMEMTISDGQETQDMHQTIDMTVSLESTP